MLFTTDNFRMDEYIASITTLRTEPTVTLDLFNRWEAAGINTKYYIFTETRQNVDRVLLPASVGAGDATIDFGTMSDALMPNVIVNIKDEAIKVDSLASGTVWNVTRAWASTIADAHAVTDTAFIVNHAEIEGCKTSTGSLLTKVERRNVLQEMTETFEITKRALRRGSKDYLSIKSEEIGHCVERKFAKLNRGMLYSRFQDTDPNGSYTFRGLKQWLLNGCVVDLWGALLDEDAFCAQLLKLAEAGSNVQTILLNPTVKNHIVKTFKGYQKEVSAGQGETGLNFGQAYEGYISDSFNGRVLRFVVDRTIPSNELFFIDRASLFVHPGLNEDGSELIMQLEQEPVCSGKEDWTLRSELTISVRNSDRQGFITNFTVA